MLSYVFRYKFSIVLAIVISLLSLVPSSSMPDSPLFDLRFLDKVVHFSMYCFFCFVALLESRCQVKCLRFHLLLIIIILIMSAIIEVLQATIVPTRSADWLDLLANFLGLFAGYIGYRIFLSLGILKFLKF